MNFMKYPTKNDISISNAVLKLAKLQNAERLELTAATGAVIVTSGRMTVKELLSTVQSLTGRAAELMTLLRLTCGDCTNCSEKCAYRDRSITELIRPAVVVPDWARQDAGLAGDAKLDCYVDEDTHELMQPVAAHPFSRYCRCWNKRRSSIPFCSVLITMKLAIRPAAGCESSWRRVIPWSA